MSEFDRGFNEGLRSAVTLSRAGCSADMLAALLDEDPAHGDPAAYQALLGELRRIMRTDLFAEMENQVSSNNEQEKEDHQLCN